jgi:hypothetical protein
MTNMRIWCINNKVIENETTSELYKRYDPNGEKAMNQRGFYTLLPERMEEEL